MIDAFERHHGIQSKQDIEAARLDYMLQNMEFNKAYRYASEQADHEKAEELLAAFKEKFKQYRVSWRKNPQYSIENTLHHESFSDAGLLPLCVDIETSSTCDLACQFCYRQWIATPDKLIKEALFYRIIDQCAELGVPSIKFNWRGEPLLHPRLPDFISYAKKGGILETIINTNAVTLDEVRSRALIGAGLDLMIYSFDGASKETYEAMRVGRFKKNNFEQVLDNIRRFARIRKEMGAVLPRTKIQMILTKDTFPEQDLFYDLFSSCVDDVSLKAYSERGGKLSELDQHTQDMLAGYLSENDIPKSAAHWRDLNGNLYISTGRLPCEQIFQRLMVTYDGRVSMCCYDWGSEYPIGYLDEQAFKSEDKDYETVLEKTRKGRKGYELLSHVKMPERYIAPPKQVQTLKEIWYGNIVNDVRKKHCEGQIEDVPVCRRCLFKDTYRWVKIGVTDASRQG